MIMATARPVSLDVRGTREINQAANLQFADKAACRDQPFVGQRFDASVAMPPAPDAASVWKITG